MDSPQTNSPIQNPIPISKPWYRRRRRLFFIGIPLLLLLLFVGARGNREEGFFQRLRNKTPTNQNPLLTGSQNQTVTTTRQVPSEYQELYTLLEGTLNGFLQKVDSQWNGQKHPVIWSDGLISANPNAGDVLLIPERFDLTLKYLDRLQELGVKGVAIDINFPLLDPEFYEDQNKYNAYLDFYKRLFAEIKKRNMVGEVEVQPIFPDYSTLDVKPYFQSLTFDEYKNRVLEQCKIIAKELKPEYLTVANEPDAAAHNSGQPLDILDNYVLEVQHVTEGLKKAGLANNMKLGAGFGTWYKDYKAASSKLAQLQNVDFINIHIYPVDAGLLDRALEISDIVKQNGKGLVLHESWLYKWKLGDNKSGGIAGAGAIYGRDIFSFWQPLDKKFVEALYKLGNYKKFDYVSFFWSNYFFGYFDYESGKSIDENKRMQQAVVSGVLSASEGKTSETGLFYKQLLSQ